MFSALRCCHSSLQSVFDWRLGCYLQNRYFPSKEFNWRTNAEYGDNDGHFPIF